MIETREYECIPATVFQRVTGELGIEEIERATLNANEIVHSVIRKYGGFNLILDARGIGFTDLNAHRKWKRTGESYPDIMAKMRYFALVLDDSPNSRAEKEFMENERQKFFFDVHEAFQWLQEMVSRSK